MLPDELDSIIPLGINRACVEYILGPPEKYEFMSYDKKKVRTTYCFGRFCKFKDVQQLEDTVIWSYDLSDGLPGCLEWVDFYFKNDTLYHKAFLIH